MGLPEFLWKIVEEFYWEIIFGIIVAIFGIIFIFGRNRIRMWLFARKVTPMTNKALSLYEKEILPEFVEAKPKIKVVERTEELPSDLPFGYIFVPEGQEELIWSTLIAYIPVSSSLRRIRILFDESLRKCMFDFLSYQLGMKLGKEEIAVKFRDNAIRNQQDDFQAMERLYKDGKLTYVVLSEASIRMQRAKGQPSVSDIEEFSTLVRKISEIDAAILRIGRHSISSYVAKALEGDRGVILLARGKYVKRAIKVSEELCQKGFAKCDQNDLGFCNPEEGVWEFANPKPPKKIGFIRIWLKRVKGQDSMKENA